MHFNFVSTVNSRSVNILCLFMICLMIKSWLTVMVKCYDLFNTSYDIQIKKNV